MMLAVNEHNHYRPVTESSHADNRYFCGVIGWPNNGNLQESIVNADEMRDISPPRQRGALCYHYVIRCQRYPLEDKTTARSPRPAARS